MTKHKGEQPSKINAAPRGSSCLADALWTCIFAVLVVNVLIQWVPA